MLKPSRSRTSLFSREKSVPSTTTASTSPESISNPTSTSVPKEVRRRSTFHNLFSPPFSSSSSGPPSPLNSPSPDLPSDPFRYSFRYTSGDFDRGRGRGRSQDEGDGHDHDHDQQRHHDDDTTSSIKHPGTSTTPKITLASPSTSTLNLVDDSSFRTRANLDPSTAHKIAKSLAKRQSPSQSHLSEIKQFQGPDSPEQPKLTPARPARRISHHASQPILSSASPPPARKDEKHPLSMRTLRRQPSMADLANARKHKEAGGEAMQRKASDATRGIGLGRQNEAWKSILSRRESEAWRELVDSRERDLVSCIHGLARHGADVWQKVPPVIDDDVSPMTKIFPAATTRSRSTTCTPQIAPAPAPAPSSKYHALSPTTSSDKHETHYMHRDGSVPILSPSLPQPDLGDPIDFSSPTHTYSHLDFSMSASSGMSRNGTVGSRLDSLPMSVAMERQPARRPAGSYPPYPVDPRELALRRLTAASGSASDIVSAKPKAVRRATSISVSKDKIEGKRVRAYSLSAKAAREVGLALSSNPIPTADKRQTSRGIYLGDLAIDLGGRYCDRSPSGTTETSLYPASTVSSPPPQSGRPLHPNLNKSEYSILAPSSIGLGFSPLGTPVSLPESLQAEAIDLTGNYAPRASDPVPPVPSQPVTPAPAPAAQSTSAPGTQGTMDPKEKPSLRRSFLLAQNTFYIPPISAPPSLRSSRSMSNIHSPVTPHVSPPVPSIPPSASAYTKRRRGTGAFICSPTDSIDPLPLPQNATSPSEAGGVSLERKRSKPFLTASNSIRMMFNPIARSLSKSFDREVKADTHNTSALESSTSGLKGKISSPINKEDEREWRAGLLKEALTASLSGTPEQEKRNGNPQSRLAIPQQLLDAPVLHEPITTNDEAGSMAEDPTQMDVEEQQQDEVRRREKRQSTNTQGAPRGLEVEAVSDIASQ